MKTSLTILLAVTVLAFGVEAGVDGSTRTAGGASGFSNPPHNPDVRTVSSSDASREPMRAASEGDRQLPVLLAGNKPGQTKRG